MRIYIFRRILQLIPVFFGITLITFFVTQLAPGDPTDLLTDLNPKISIEAKQKLLEIRGLDKPVFERYVNWITNIAMLDFGRSFKDGEPAINKIAKRIPITLTINGLSILLVLLAAIPIGVISAVKENTKIDHLITLFVFICFSMPTFWFALLLMSFFGAHLHLLPISGITSIDFEYMTTIEKVRDVASHLILPVIASTITGFAGVSRFMRTGMLEVLKLDYIQTARSKGLPERTVLYKHAFRNAVLPIVTIIGLSIPALLGGSVIFETIFSIPGMGKLMFDSIMSRDIFVYMTILLIGAILTLLGNLIADIAYRMVDPRIKYE